MSTYYNVSLISPDSPSLDPMSKEKWKLPLVPLMQAIRAKVDNPKDVVIGDPTDFSSIQDILDRDWETGDIKLTL